MNKLIRSVALCILALVQGCATVHMLGSDKSDPPLVYAGTRLNYYVLQQGCCVAERFGAVAPSYPALDLPFSVVLDTLLLPFALAASLGVHLAVSGGS